MKFIDFFAGIGGFRRGLELSGHECVGFCEWDKFAAASYTSMHLITEEQRKYLETLPLKQRQKEILKEEYRNGEWYSNDIRSVEAGMLPKADCWTFGAPCFVKGTLITTSRGMIPIEEIQPGDFVLTHKNRFKKVVKPMLNVKKGIYTLKVQGSPLTECTGNHRFYVRDKRRIWDNGNRTYRIEISEPYWKPVEDFNGSELVEFTVNKNEENIYQLSDIELWLLGRYVADGYLRDGERKNRPSRCRQVIFCIGDDKKDDFEAHCGELNYNAQMNKTVSKYIFSNKRLFELCEKCGKGAENKHIPQFVLNLPKELLTVFLDGYMSGDGSCKDGCYKATTVSKVLAYQLGQCIQKVYNINYSIHFTKRPSKYIIDGREVNQKDTWQVVYRPNSIKHNGYMIDGVLWQPVKEVKLNTKRVEVVYNMEVEDDNSYTANNLGVHNCQDFSVAGRRAGLDGDRSSLVREIFRLLEELEEKDRPEWLIYENVKGMFSTNSGLDYLSILSEMDRGGYDAEWQIINSSWYVPQNRERVYTVGHLRTYGRTEIFPVEGTDGENSVSIIAHRDGYRRNLQTYSDNGITEALDTAGGGGREFHIAKPVFCDINRGGVQRHKKPVVFRPDTTKESQITEQKSVELLSDSCQSKDRDQTNRDRRMSNGQRL